MGKEGVRIIKRNGGNFGLNRAEGRKYARNDIFNEFNFDYH